jgi:meiosis-specific transcription factor NDT80
VSTEPRFPSLTADTLYSPPPLTPPVTFATSGIGIPGSSHLLTRSHIDRSFPSYSQQSGMASGYNSMRPLASPFAYRNGTYNAYPQHEHAYHHTVPIPHAEPAKPEGPPFEKTIILHEVYSQQNHELKPEISATIQKGFFQVDGKWTCYRRNYFTVACSFSFKPSNGDGRFYISSHKQLRLVEQFAVSISAKTAAVNNQESEQRKLVQHTPKRDKATETEPDKHLVSPAPAHSMHSNGHMNSLVGLMPNAVGSLMHGYANFDSPGQQSPPSSYTFERIQFQKATANNGKRRAQQQYFHVVVELSAFISNPHDGENWVVIATRDSEPMVVRGRSPGHYKDNNRRDSQTSMDRDHNAGGGSDGSTGSYGYAPHHHHHSGMDWSSSRSGHHGHHYHGSGNTYSTRAVSARSPASGSSSTTLTESPTSTDFTLSEADTLKSATFCFEHSTQTTGCDSAEEPLFSLSRSPFSRKRSLEEDSSDEETPYHCSPPFCDLVMSNPFELPGLLHPKALCASS